MAEESTVYAFPEYLEQARSLARHLNTDCVPIAIHHFPDGESGVRVPVPAARHAILCRSLFHPNDKLVELMLAIATLREQGVERITLVAPYLCYMRQDIAFHPGEAISQRIVGRFLASQVDALITVDPHLHRISQLQQAVPIPQAIAATAAPLIADFLGDRSGQPILIGPDTESEQWVQAIAAPNGFDYVIAKKQRNGDRLVEIELPDKAYCGRDVVLVDDIASTGRTLATAARQLKQAGVHGLFAVVTHAVFVDDALEHILASGIQQVWSTDSIPHSTNSIALAPLLAQEIRDLDF